MFIATMYSYGSDAESVGVDGIRGCLGIFLATNTQLHAIHIPDTPARFDAGRTAFVAHVHHADPHFVPAEARLFAVMNGPNRPGADAELLAYSQDLNVHRRMTVRVNEFLGPKGFGQDAAAILCERIPGTTQCRLKYKRYDDVSWQHGVGTVRAGYYHSGAYDAVLRTNAALAQGWHLVDNTNSTIATVNW
jgi:hypothetical protein